MVAEPVPLAAAVHDLLERLDLADRQLQLRLQAWREGYAAGERAHAADYDRGYRDGYADVIDPSRRAAHDIAAALAIPDRWNVRGQHRTRGTFAQPHPRDYPGRGGAA